MPDIDDILDMYVSMKGGKKKRRRGGQPEDLRRPPEPEFGSLQEQQAYQQTIGRENAAIKRSAKHITTQPLFVQRSFALSKKPLSASGLTDVKEISKPPE
jgi:hypothetical protein